MPNLPEPRDNRKLTPAEREELQTKALTMYLEGHTQRQIALELEISPSTAHRYIDQRIERITTPEQHRQMRDANGVERVLHSNWPSLNQG